MRSHQRRPYVAKSESRVGRSFRRVATEGTTLSQESLAYDVFGGSVSANELQEVPLDAWFPDRPMNVEFGVSEQSMLPPRFGVVLTILTLGDADEE